MMHIKYDQMSECSLGSAKDDFDLQVGRVRTGASWQTSGKAGDLNCTLMYYEATGPRDYKLNPKESRVLVVTD